MEKLSQEEIQKAMRECVVSSYTYDPANPNGYSQDLFDVENEVFAKDYEFIEKCGLDDMVMVPEVGLEPTQGCPYQILSLARLPVSPLGLFENFKI